MSSPFDFTKSINETKENLIREDPLTENDYSPFIVNRSLSYFRDTVFFANEMNRYSSLPKKQQYEFYLHGVPKRKRFSKWSKKESETVDIVALLMIEYNLSRRRAEESLKLLSNDQIKVLQELYDHGGSSSSSVKSRRKTNKNK